MTLSMNQFQNDSGETRALVLRCKKYTFTSSRNRRGA
jgi:hypothetical protein